MLEQYRETIWWKEIIVILGVFSALFFGMVIRVYIDKPDAWEYLIILFISMCIIFSFLTVNFRKLDILVTDENLAVSFGCSKRVFSLDNIEKAMTDKDAKPFVLGFGIRMTRFEKEWVLVYNVIFARTAVLHLKEGKARYFVFSTKNPEKIVEIINTNLNKAKPDGQSDD